MALVSNVQKDMYNSKTADSKPKLSEHQRHKLHQSFT